MSIRNSVEELVTMVEQGQILEAYEKFYAENVAMRENTGVPVVGKDTNREREIATLSTVRNVHENRADFVVVDGNRAVIGWKFEFTNTEGVRLRLDQIAVQQWESGQIVDERFVYDTASVMVSGPETVLA
jgi:hypothetical protein